MELKAELPGTRRRSRDVRREGLARGTCGNQRNLRRGIAGLEAGTRGCSRGTHGTSGGEPRAFAETHRTSHARHQAPAWEPAGTRVKHKEPCGIPWKIAEPHESIPPTGIHAMVPYLPMGYRRSYVGSRVCLARHSPHRFHIIILS